jgi:hypothetical protein
MKRAFHDFVESAGFSVMRVLEDDGGLCAFLAARKRERRFVVGLEGFNPGVATFHGNN